MPMGRRGCDCPLSLIDSALKQMTKVDPDPDFILITGDFIGHRVREKIQDDGFFNVTANNIDVNNSFFTTM